MIKRLLFLGPCQVDRPEKGKREPGKEQQFVFFPAAVDAAVNAHLVTEGKNKSKPKKKNRNQNPPSFSL